jgi:regulator of cell morphogenesis and NO signaling
MEIFDRKQKMVSMIRSNFMLLPVVNRFGIRLGVKDKTIEELCFEQQISPDFFLAIVNTYHNKNYFPEEELLSFSPLLILNYLTKTHRYYLEYVLPKIDKLLAHMVSGCTKYCSQLMMIENFYRNYKNELILHINDEEENTFPYIRTLVSQNRIPDSGYSIHVYEKEHTNVDVKLNDLKNLIIKYIEPSYDDNDCNEFLITLSRFEKDIWDHARIEDKRLMPKVFAIEKTLRK